jgi:hypothetical protein
MAITLDGTNGINSSGVIVAPDGSASAPAITNDGDTNTGIFFPAADTIAFAEGGVEAMRIDSSGRVGIGTTSPTQILDLANTSASAINIRFRNSSTDTIYVGADTTNLVFYNGGSERMRIDSSGNLLVGRTDTNFATSAGFTVLPTQGIAFSKSTTSTLGAVAYFNRMAAVGDGNLVEFAESGTIEGTISVSGSTVSYNGGHLSRWAQMLTKPELLKGTVLSNLDEMNVYVDADGNPVENEQLNKVKVSDVEGDANVAGVFVNWSYDEAHQVDEINMAMTGDMIIRIAQGVTVARGDLLMSAGDGTAKPQGDDIVRSKTIAKVTSTHVTCTYDDGSYCVPCVLMAC